MGADGGVAFQLFGLRVREGAAVADLGFPRFVALPHPDPERGEEVRAGCSGVKSARGAGGKVVVDVFEGFLACEG